MRRAIVHVGLPRTGTTTLQRVLVGMRPRLLEAGISYPELTPRSASEPHLSHQHLGEALDGRRPRAERDELLQSLSAQIAATQSEIVLLSYEGLCIAPRWLRVPRTLAALFARHGFAMEVLVTLKPQDELVNSAYTWRTQFVREARKFDAYFRAEINQPHLDLLRLMEPWRRASGGRLIAVPTRAAKSNRPLVERVFDALGILPQLGGMIGAADLAVVENRSPGPIAVEVARLLRRGGAQIALGRDVREATRFVEAAARARGLNDVPFIGLDDAKRAAAAARWGGANDRFAREVWGENWLARVAPQPIRPCNEAAQSDVVRDILAEVCARYDLKLAPGPLLSLRDAAASVGSRLHQLARYGRALRL